MRVDPILAIVEGPDGVDPDRGLTAVEEHAGVDLDRFRITDAVLVDLLMTLMNVEMTKNAAAGKKKTGRSITIDPVVKTVR